jgi:hypothetical protein
MHNPNVYIPINRARTEELRRAALESRQRRLAAMASRDAPRQGSARSASPRRAIERLNRPPTGKAAAAGSQQR